MAFCLELRDKEVLGSSIGKLAAWFEGLKSILKRFVKYVNIYSSFADKNRSTGQKMANLFQSLARTHSTFCGFRERITLQPCKLAKLRMTALKQPLK